MTQPLSPSPLAGEGRGGGAERSVVVNSLAEARAAAASAAKNGEPLLLRSAPAAAGYAGPGWFASIAETVAAEFPTVAVAAELDCGGEAGSVLAALRRGLKRVRFTGTQEAAARLADIAAQYGATLAIGPAGNDPSG